MSNLLYWSEPRPDGLSAKEGDGSNEAKYDQIEEDELQITGEKQLDGTWFKLDEDHLGPKHLTDAWDRIKERHDKARRPEFRKEWNRKSLLALASQLNLTDPQKQQAIEFFDQFDLEKGGALSVEEVALAAISMAANMDDRAIQREDRYEEFRSDLKADRKSIRTARRNIRDRHLVDRELRNGNAGRGETEVSMEYAKKYNHAKAYKSDSTSDDSTTDPGPDQEMKELVEKTKRVAEYINSTGRNYSPSSDEVTHPLAMDFRDAVEVARWVKHHTDLPTPENDKARHQAE